MVCYVRIGTSYMGEKLQATPKKQDLGTSWRISGDQSFPGSTPRPSYVPPPVTRGVHVAIFTHFAKRQIATYLIQQPIVTQPSFPE